MSQAKDSYLRRRDKFIKNFLEIADPETGLRAALQRLGMNDGEHARLILSDELWEPLMVPLQITTIGLFEVYLEEFFLEKCINKRFNNKVQIFKNRDEFENLFYKFPELDRRIIDKNFSFQRLTCVEELLLKVMNCNIRSYPKFSTLQFNFQIRHQFTHNCAKVTQSYIEIHNAFFEDSPENQLTETAIGQDLRRNVSTMKSVLELIDEIVNYVEANSDDYTL